jgi:predicted small lipoprotein YifL
MKRLIAALLAGLTLFALVGCSAGNKADSAAPKDYSQILHDARTDEENEYDMIFTKGEDGKFTAIDGYSAEYEAGQLDDEVRNLMMPLLNLEDDMYTDLAASVSSMMVRSYAVAIVKPAEGKTDAVKSALEAYVTSEQQSMEHYLEDQYQIAKAATVTVAPTGEVILVCAENHDTLLANIEKALAA